MFSNGGRCLVNLSFSLQEDNTTIGLYHQTKTAFRIESILFKNTHNTCTLIILLLHEDFWGPFLVRSILTSCKGGFFFRCVLLGKIFSSLQGVKPLLFQHCDGRTATIILSVNHSVPYEPLRMVMFFRLHVNISF